MTGAWYASVTPPDVAATPPLAGDATAEVLVIGGGLLGVSTALALAERGCDVLLVEAGTIGAGASGRAGGLLLPGYTISQSTLARLTSTADAQWFWEQSVEAQAQVRHRVAQHAIACDWRDGSVVAALRPSHLAALAAEVDSVGGDALELLDAEALAAHVVSPRYCGGVRDRAGAHVNPLALCRGLAQVARSAGARLHEHTTVHGVDLDAGTARTSTGTLRARAIVLATNAATERLVPSLGSWLLPAATFMIATAPLGSDRAAALLPSDQAITDSAFVMDYFRRSSDHRLLFGGGVSYFAREPAAIARTLRARMLAVFPSLADVAIDFAWSGRLDISFNRMLLTRRLGGRGLTVLGFSGHGLVLSVGMGVVLAEALTGQPARFERFAAVPHQRFPGGRWLRAPATRLGVSALALWDRWTR